MRPKDAIVFDPCGSRQIDMQAFLLGSLLAGINFNLIWLSLILRDKNN